MMGAATAISTRTRTCEIMPSHTVITEI
jgi:hypothetical protein